MTWSLCEWTDWFLYRQEVIYPGHSNRLSSGKVWGKLKEQRPVDNNNFSKILYRKSNRIKPMQYAAVMLSYSLTCGLI